LDVATERSGLIVKKRSFAEAAQRRALAGFFTPLAVAQ
jgi:hypothetical protein